MDSSTDLEGGGANQVCEEMMVDNTDSYPSYHEDILHKYHLFYSSITIYFWVMQPSSLVILNFGPVTTHSLT